MGTWDAPAFTVPDARSPARCMRAAMHGFSEFFTTLEVPVVQAGTTRRWRGAVAASHGRYGELGSDSD